MMVWFTHPPQGWVFSFFADRAQLGTVWPWVVAPTAEGEGVA
jgi:hypothetical protein